MTGLLTVFENFLTQLNQNLVQKETVLEFFTAN